MKIVLFSCLLVVSFFATSCATLPITSQGLTVLVPKISAAAGEKISVPINVQDINPGVIGIDLFLEYDPQYLQFVDCALGSLTRNWNVVGRDSDDKNKVSIALYGTRPLPHSKGNVAVVHFTVKQDAPVGVKSKLHVSRASFNDKPVQNVLDGSFVLIEK